MTVYNIGHRGSGAGQDLDPVAIEAAIFLERHRGVDWYVNSTLSSAGNGGSWTSALASIEAASNTGAVDDRIHVAPLHVETVIAAAGLNLNTAGQTFIGYGNGDRRPQINFTTVVGADMDIGAAGITMSNFRFTGGIDALTGPIDVNAADFTMLDCITEDVTDQCTDFIVTDANADRMTLKRWTHRGAAAAGADTAITIVGGDQITIEDAVIDGNFAVGCIENVTTAATNLRIYGGISRYSYMRTRNDADLIIVFVSTSTGDVGPHLYGRLNQNAANITEAFGDVGTDMQMWPPIGVINLDGETAFGVGTGSIMPNFVASTDA